MNKTKKTIFICICIAGIIIVSGCEKNDAKTALKTEKTTAVGEVLEQGMKADDVVGIIEENVQKSRQSGVNEGAPIPESNGGKDASLSSTEGIDIDLTELSSNIVYSEVYNMMAMPDDFIGKMIKMDGTYTCFYDELTKKNYYACIVQDATACCAQGIEFELTDDYTYPDDYPKEGDFITVSGVFDTYMEGGYLYCTLRKAKLL
ncbi:MAG: hypothetical protein K6B28_03340 [Lachnospiraceae bacterium]|nr:hypothetical protein [Lachnospiraceae bacterium]